MEKRNRGHRMIRLRFIAGSPAHFSSVFQILHKNRGKYKIFMEKSRGGCWSATPRQVVIFVPESGVFAFRTQIYHFI